MSLNAGEKGANSLLTIADKKESKSIRQGQPAEGWLRRAICLYLRPTTFIVYALQYVNRALMKQRLRANYCVGISRPIYSSSAVPKEGGDRRVPRADPYTFPATSPVR